MKLVLPNGKLRRDAFAYEDVGLRDRILKATRQIDPNPTEDQKKAGNYQKGHATIQGLPITLENFRGGTRCGIDKDGKPWSVVMAHHYGYIKRTESEADGDHIDVFVGPNPESEMVFVIDQVKASGRFDEHKCMIGFTNEREAVDGYLANYAPGWDGLGSIKAMRMLEFKDWIKNGETGRRIEEQSFTYGNDISDLIVQLQLQELAKAQKANDKDAIAKHTQKWADETRRRIAMERIFADYHYEGEDGARFVTIGGHAEGDKKHVGGKVIKIGRDGKIIGGVPSSMKGTNVSDIKQNFDKLNQKNKETPSKVQDAPRKTIVSPNGKMVVPATRSAQANAPKVAHETIKQILAAKKDILGEDATAADINEGNCALFAETLWKNLGSPKDAVFAWTPGETHAWLEIDGKAYDAERPDGVNDWKELPANSTELKSTPTRTHDIAELKKAYGHIEDLPNEDKSLDPVKQAPPSQVTIAPNGKMAVPEKKKPFGKQTKGVKSHAEKKLQLNYDPKKDRTGDTLYKIVSRMGGINRDSVSSHGLDLSALLQGSLSGLFPRKGGYADLSELAETLHDEGHIVIPGYGVDTYNTNAEQRRFAANPGEYLISQLEKKAKSASADNDAEYEKSYNAYLKEKADAEQYASESEIASVVQRGEEDGVLQEAKGDAWEGDGEFGSDQETASSQNADLDDVPFEDDESLSLYAFVGLIDKAGKLARRN